jgi:hypothetical protein
LNGSTQEMCPGFWAWLPSGDCNMYDAGVSDATPADAPTDALLPDVPPAEAGPVDSGVTPMDASD